MRSRFHRTAYISLLCLLAVCMTTSVFATNLAWVLLLANWVAEWNWRDKFADFRHNYLLHAFMALLAVHAVWLIGTENLTYALFDLQKKLPLFALPLIILTTAPPNREESLCIGGCYVTTIFVVTAIGLVRYLTIADLPYREIVPFISHIRFSLNICLALALLTWTSVKYRKKWLRLLNLALSAWFLYFLILIQSYTACVILVAGSVILLTLYRKRMPRAIRTALFALVGGTLLTIMGFCAHHCYEYYHLKPLSTQPLADTTPNGNRYTHGNDGLIENGNYVHHYICKQELRQEWDRRSNVPFDATTNTGWTIYPTLLRYLNGIGVTKDSLGMTYLTAEDIDAIERGIANPAYLTPGLRKMVYTACYEYENYRCYNSVNNFSMLQRIELWRNGFAVFLQHPLLGVGTGDVVDACQARLAATHSPLAHKGMHTHSQYLNFLLAFGTMGFSIILFFFIRAIVRTGSSSRILFAAHFCIVLISFISEDTLETLAGIVFTALFMSLLSSRTAAPHPTAYSD